MMVFEKEINVQESYLGYQCNSLGIHERKKIWEHDYKTYTTLLDHIK